MEQILYLLVMTDQWPLYWFIHFFSIGSARKLLSIRLFDDEAGKRWQKSVKDLQYEILCVSQFTLYNRLKGNKPDFHLAMQGAEASNLYNLLLQKLGTDHSADKIKGDFFTYSHTPHSFICSATQFIWIKMQTINLNSFADGKFGAMMQVHIQNDGPVTIEIESPKKE